MSNKQPNRNNEAENMDTDRRQKNDAKGAPTSADVDTEDTDESDGDTKSGVMSEAALRNAGGAFSTEASGSESSDDEGGGDRSHDHDGSDVQKSGGGSGGDTHSKQTEHERRELRKAYRNVIEETKKSRENIVGASSDELIDRLEVAQDMFSAVQATREAVLDAKLLHLISGMGRQHVQGLHTNLITFQPVEFSEKLVTHVSGGVWQQDEPDLSLEQWAKFGKQFATPMLKTAPSFHFLFGTFERGEVNLAHIRRPRNAAQDKNNAEPKNPKNLINPDKSEQEATTEEIERVYGILCNLSAQNDGSPIDYFEFVVNPDSFGHTIENIFHVSFLVRDGLAKIELDECKLPTLLPILRKSAGDQEETMERKQFVISLTIKDWEEIKQVYQIENALIEPRK